MEPGLIVAAIALMLFGFWVLWGASASRGVETVGYKTERKLDKAVEIRSYGKTVIARTLVDISNNPENSAFGRIAGYIFGSNERDERIAMTAPVVTRRVGAKMEMYFTMPRAYGKKDLPEPADKSVQILEMPPRRVAVISFSGYASSRSIAQNEKQLLSVLEKNAIRTNGPPFLMQYNDPWTPPFMRRNEIGIQIEEVKDR